MGNTLNKKVETIIHADYKKENQKKITKGAVISFLLIVLVSSIIGFIAIRNSPAAQCQKYARMMYIKDHKEEPEFDYLLIEYTDTLENFKEKSNVSYQELYNIVFKEYYDLHILYTTGEIHEEVGMLQLMDLTAPYLPNQYDNPELLPVTAKDLKGIFEAVKRIAWSSSWYTSED